MLRRCLAGLTCLILLVVSTTTEPAEARSAIGPESTIEFPAGDIIESPTQVFYFDASPDTIRVDFWLLDRSTGNYLEYPSQYSSQVQFLPGLRTETALATSEPHFARARLDGLAPGAYELRSIAFAADGTREESAARIRFEVVEDVEPPTARLLQPSNLQVLDSGFVTVHIRSTDNVPEQHPFGRKEVTYQLVDIKTGEFFKDGHGRDTFRAFHYADLPINVFEDKISLPNGRYRIITTVTDANGNTAPTRKAFFRVDEALEPDDVAPTVELYWPADDAILATAELQLRATYQDDAPIANPDGQVVAIIKDLATGEFVHSDGTLGARELLRLPTQQVYGDEQAMGNFEVPPGQYQIGIRAIDSSGNKSPFTFSRVTIEAPTVPNAAPALVSAGFADVQVGSIDVADDGTVYVGDNVSLDVFAFTPTGELVETIDLVDGPDTDDRFRSVSAVAASPDGALLVFRGDEPLHVAADRTQTFLRGERIPTDVGPDGTAYFVGQPDDVDAYTVTSDAAGVRLSLAWQYELDPSVCDVAFDGVSGGVYGLKCGGVITRVDPGHELSLTIAPDFSGPEEVGGSESDVTPGFALDGYEFEFDANGNLWIVSDAEVVVQTPNGELIARYDFGTRIAGVASGPGNTMYVAPADAAATGVFVFTV